MHVEFIQWSENYEMAVAWFDGPEDGVPEPAIALRTHTDTIEIRQGDNSVLIANADWKAFIKFLRLYGPHD